MAFLDTNYGVNWFRDVWSHSKRQTIIPLSYALGARNLWR